MTGRPGGKWSVQSLPLLWKWPILSGLRCIGFTATNRLPVKDRKMQVNNVLDLYSYKKVKNDLSFIFKKMNLNK